MIENQLWTARDTIDNDGYYRHRCGCILLRVDKNADINGAYCFCKKCRKEIKLQDIVNGKIFYERKIAYPTERAIG